MKFKRETEHIYRLRVPFEDLYTSVYLLRSEDGLALVDCATTAEDVDGVILPALRALGMDFSDIAFLILTHRHGDHAGGRERILEWNPRITVIDASHKIAPRGFALYEMKGHTPDSIGVLELVDGVLISGDGLQGHGVGKYRCSLESEADYLKTIEKIRRDPRVKSILFSHAYEPWYKDSMIGREAVECCLDDCELYVKKQKCK